MSVPNWIDRQEYPFEPQHFQVDAGRLHYIDEGSGSPVVMVHGNPTWSFVYRKLIKQLRREYRCVAMDHLGFGLSDTPRGWSYLPEDHASNLAALIDGLGLKDVTLVVQDWGGPIGLSYAVARPENVARIVILNTWAWPVNRNPYYIAFSSVMGGPVGRLLIRRHNFFAKVMMPLWFGNKRKLTEKAHEHYLRALAAPEDRDGCIALPKQILTSSRWLAQIWMDVSLLHEKPVLIVWGMKDIAFRKKELERWEQTFPDAQSIHLKGVGHFVQEEAPEELGAAISSFCKQPATE